jgi:hypothetical protein
MGDGKNADACSGHYSSHTKGVKRMCHACDVRFDKLSDPNHVCKFFTAEPIKHLVETSLSDKVIGHGTNKSEIQKMMEKEELPKEFWEDYPEYEPPSKANDELMPNLEYNTASQAGGFYPPSLRRVNDCNDNDDDYDSDDDFDNAEELEVHDSSGLTQTGKKAETKEDLLPQ